MALVNVVIAETTEDIVVPFVAETGDTYTTPSLLVSTTCKNMDKLTKAPLQQDMPDLATGSIAFKLGLAPAPSDYTGGCVNKGWLSKGPVEDQCEAMSACDVQERFNRVHGVDKDCSEGMHRMINGDIPVSTLDDWKKMLLVANETEVMSLPCVGLHGMPSASRDACIGESMLLLTKIEDGTRVKHRLHFCIMARKASLEVEESWGEQTSGCLCLKRTSRKVKLSHTSVHAQSMTFVTLNVEDNLFHVHGKTEDSAEMVVQFGGGDHNKSRCSVASCSMCCSAWPCYSCCSGSEKNGDGFWSGSTRFEELLKFHTERVAEESLKDVNYKFPGMMDASNEKEERALVTKQLHCLNLIYCDSATNSIQSCTAVVKPDEPIHNLLKFASSLSTFVTSDPAKTKADPWTFASVTKSLFGANK